MVTFPEAWEVCARRRHLHEYVRSCGDPAAGPRHGGRPPPPPHHLAAPAPRSSGTSRHRTACAAAARLTAPRSVWTTLEAQHAFWASPGLRKRFTCPPSRIQLLAFIIGSKYYIVINSRLWKSDDGAAIVLNVLYEERLVEETGSAAVRPRAGRGRRWARRAGLGRPCAGLAYLSAQRRHPEPHPHAGRRDRRAQWCQGLPWVGASERCCPSVAVDGACTRFSVRRRPRNLRDWCEQTEARRTVEIPGNDDTWQVLCLKAANFGSVLRFKPC